MTQTATPYEPKRHDRVEICDPSHEFHGKIFHVDSIMHGSLELRHPFLGDGKRVTAKKSQVVRAFLSSELSSKGQSLGVAASAKKDRIQTLKGEVRMTLWRFLGNEPTPELVDKLVQTAVSAAKK